MSNSSRLLFVFLAGLPSLAFAQKPIVLPSKFDVRHVSDDGQAALGYLGETVAVWRNDGSKQGKFTRLPDKLPRGATLTPSDLFLDKRNAKYVAINVWAPIRSAAAKGDVETNDAVSLSAWYWDIERNVVARIHPDATEVSAVSGDGKCVICEDRNSWVPFRATWNGRSFDYAELPFDAHPGWMTSVGCVSRNGRVIYGHTSDPEGQPSGRYFFRYANGKFSYYDYHSQNDTLGLGVHLCAPDGSFAYGAAGFDNDGPYSLVLRDDGTVLEAEEGVDAVFCDAAGNAYGYTWIGKTLTAQMFRVNPNGKVRYYPELRNSEDDDWVLPLAIASDGKTLFGDHGVWVEGKGTIPVKEYFQEKDAKYMWLEGVSANGRWCFATRISKTGESELTFRSTAPGKKKPTPKPKPKPKSGREYRPHGAAANVYAAEAFNGATAALSEPGGYSDAGIYSYTYAYYGYAYGLYAGEVVKWNAAKSKSVAYREYFDLRYQQLLCDYYAMYYAEQRYYAAPSNASSKAYYMAMYAIDYAGKDFGS